LSNFSIHEEKSIPGRTLSPLYNDKQNGPPSSTMHLFYNDQPPKPDQTSFTSGHTKGVLAFNEDKGIWLVHSVPHYPPKPKSSKYDYPHTGERYGQTFLCISLSTPESVNDILEQLLYNTPNIYSYDIPSWFQSKYPRVKALIRGDQEKGVPFHKAQLRSIGGTLFTSFAKNSMFHRDLYADFVAPELKTGLLVETWPNGRGKLESWCKGLYHVENVDELQFPIEKVEEYDFKTTHDHSKWAISHSTTNQVEEEDSNESDQDNKKKIVCIGDINRMKTQFKRGGGTVCFENSNTWRAFDELVKVTETCPLK
jgi:deoxyribonuclease-2